MNEEIFDQLVVEMLNGVAADLIVDSTDKHSFSTREYSKMISALGMAIIVPKSQHWGLLDKPDLAGDMDGLMSYLTDQQKTEFKPVPIELKKGYAAFHHPLMVHGSFANKSERSRRAFVLNVFAEGTKSNTDETLLEGVPPIKKGAKMEGSFSL